MKKLLLSAALVALCLMGPVAASAQPPAPKPCNDGSLDQRVKCLEQKIQDAVAGANAEADKKINAAFERSFQFQNVRRNMCAKVQGENEPLLMLSCNNGDGDWHWKLMPLK